MEAAFWEKKWQDNEIGFHQKEFNPLMVRYFKALDLAKGCRVFIPLCGKTHDIAWFLSQGYQVVGVELSEKAVVQLFESLGVTPEVTQCGDLVKYSSVDVEVFVGDFFRLNRKILGRVDAIYDRAALVALPHEMRQDYTAHLVTSCGGAPQLLINFEYDQLQMNGPPFSISKTELEAHYSLHYQITLKESTAVPGGLKGVCPAVEQAWLLN
ncbi:thiopurine S-methyltransferase [Marinicella rhabdoformis]|uniref:thiopurine S-methyltransferase n=1 Tax=Marinicella rhabdoformis TaxID=2580566 RepID=UPI0012AEBCAA|nr:thiopurine S-methyltransferase [Marinicella rhabdoformis]